MQNHKSMEEVIMTEEISPNGGPVLHRQVAGIKKWVVLNDGIDDAIPFQRTPVGYKNAM